MWPYPRMLAHRGGGILAPENTIAALRCGHAYGFSGVEFDVMLAGDGVPVLMHDPVFGRTIQACGKVADFRADELSGMDVGSWFSSRFIDEGVPTLDQAMRFCVEHGIWMNIEIKPAPGQDVKAGLAVGWRVRAFCEASDVSRPRHAGRPSMPLLSSFSRDALLAARGSAPQVARALLVDALPENWHEMLRQCEAVALHINHAKLTREIAADVKNAGVGLFCYTVNDPERAVELLAWGVDAFCTDRLADIRPNSAFF
jgi:glycerophosphoryl diester phosphodiesterase